MQKQILILVLICVPFFINAQSLAVNTDGTTAHPNALVDIKGTNKGLLIPRGNAATRTVLNTNTAKGLLMYDTVLNTVWMHNGNGLATGWNSLATGTNHWELNGTIGTEIKNTNAGGFWSANATTVASIPPVIQPPVSGAGTRMMWIPQRSAFRVGTVLGNKWNADSIGSFSFASGYDVKAKGDFATAFGIYTNAIGYNSTAMGNSTEASGLYSTTMGQYTQASGNYSIAMGNGTNASGDNSAAMGQLTEASGGLSIAMGERTKARGLVSTAIGIRTIAKAFGSLSIGGYNDSIATADPINWISTDPLFQIGNGTNISPHNAMVVYKNGNMVLKNPTTVTTDPVGFTVPISGAGTRMMWLPEKSAFRVGTVFGNNWDADSIGTWSFAAGYDSKATGNGSIALGIQSIARQNGSAAIGFAAKAIGLNSIALGAGTISSSYASTAMGYNTIASGMYSVALGNETTSFGTYSIAMGYRSIANGSYSTAIGNFTKADGYNSIAFGSSTIADGINSTAMGLSTTASGNYSTTMGLGTVSKSLGSLAIGLFNDSIATSSTTTTVLTDPVFYIGNGVSNISRSNAFVVYKNGNTDISGYTQLGKLTDGAPAIKMKKLTLNTSASQGACTFVAHGLTQSKILSISGLATVAGGFQILPNHLQAGFQYTLNVDNTNIAVCTVAGNSGSILNATVKIVVVYEE
jgi:hypothetical protein